MQKRFGTFEVEVNQIVITIHRRESGSIYDADRVILAREDARSASNIMLPMNFEPFLHNLYYVDFRVESSHTSRV